MAPASRVGILGKRAIESTMISRWGWRDGQFPMSLKRYPPLARGVIMERATGFEPANISLGS